MIDDILILNLRKIAIKHHLSNSFKDYVRRAYKHYSTTYFTPLEDSYKIDEPKIILIYMEDQLNNTPKEELENMLYDIKSNKPMLDPNIMPEMTYDQVMEMEDDAWIAEQEKLVKEQEKEENKDKVEARAKKLREKSRQAIAQLDKMMGGARKDSSDIKEGSIKFGEEDKKK